VTQLRASAGLILGAMLPFILCGQVDQVALVNQARAKIVANIKRLPKYTCLQTVRRSRFEKVPSVRSRSCSYLDGSAKNLPRLSLAWTDRFKLDVTVSAGAEIFSWAGAESFQSEHLEKIVGTGMAGTGDFGPFLMSIFGSGASGYENLGLEQDKGRTLAVYRYHVPMSASRYEFNVGPRSDDTVTLAYEGKFWIDSQNAELSRMTIEVPHPPQESETCRIETTIDYRQARIGDSDFLLPQLTVLKLWDVEVHRYENQIEYASCREFRSETVFRTDSEGAAAGASEVSKTPVSIPPGIRIKIALRSKIDFARSFAGDAIEGQLLNAIGDTVPKGAVVHGRIVRFQREYLPSNYIAIGLKFDSAEVNGRAVPLTLIPATRGASIRPDRIEKRQGIGMFTFPVDRLVLDQKFVSEWKTMAGKPAK
jgi:hypothetical protein